MFLRVRARMGYEGYNNTWFEDYKVKSRETAIAEVKTHIQKFNEDTGASRKLLKLTVIKNQDLNRHVWKQTRKSVGEVEVWRCLRCKRRREIMMGPPNRDFCIY